MSKPPRNQDVSSSDSRLKVFLFGVFSHRASGIGVMKVHWEEVILFGGLFCVPLIEGNYNIPSSEERGLGIVEKRTAVKVFLF